MVVITALRLCNFTIWSKCVLFFFYSTLVHCVCSPVVVHFDVRFLAIRYFLMSVLSLFLAFASDFSIALDHTHTLFGHAELFCILCGSVLFCFVPFILLATCLFYFLRSPIQGKRQNIQNSIIDSIHIYTRTLTTHK